MEKLLALAIIAEARKKGLEHSAVTIECMTEFDDFEKHLMSVYSVYLKPCDKFEDNAEREKALLTQRTAFRNLIRAFEITLSRFERQYAIPNNLLEIIKKEI